MNLLLASLAVFFVWESAYSAIPWNIPAWLQPVLVYGVALCLLWPDWSVALSACGLVALLHVGVQRLVPTPPSPASSAQALTRRNTRAGVPSLP